MTEGNTQEEALINLEDARVRWVEVKFEDWEQIPAPATGRQRFWAFDGETRQKLPAIEAMGTARSFPYEP